MKDDPTNSSIESSHRPWWKQARWRWALAGFAMGVFDIALSDVFGLEFRIGETDVLPAVGLFLSFSFALFGFLIGFAQEAKEKEQDAYQRLRLQVDELALLQARLAQSEKLASLGQLASTLAHEVRNPLAIMRSQIQNLAETLRPEDEGHQICGTVIEEIDHLSRVTTSLVRFAKPVPLNRSQVSARNIVERAALLARPMTEERSICLRVGGSAPSLDQAFSADPDLVCQVLIGLISNALEVTESGDEILLEWQSSGQQVHFSVIDPGPGVPETLRQRVFEPFFTTRPEGSGLGLAIARQIVEAHGGALEIGEGGGSKKIGASFTLSLPVKG